MRSIERALFKNKLERDQFKRDQFKSNQFKSYQFKRDQFKDVHFKRDQSERDHFKTWQSQKKSEPFKIEAISKKINRNDITWRNKNPNSKWQQIAHIQLLNLCTTKTQTSSYPFPFYFFYPVIFDSRTEGIKTQHSFPECYIWCCILAFFFHF